MIEMTVPDIVPESESHDTNFGDDNYSGVDPSQQEYTYGNSYVNHYGNNNRITEESYTKHNLIDYANQYSKYNFQPNDPYANSTVDEARNSNPITQSKDLQQDRNKRESHKCTEAKKEENKKSNEKSERPKTVRKSKRFKLRLKFKTACK